MIKICHKKFYVMTKTTLVLVTNYNSLFGWNLTSCISQDCYPLNFFSGVISSYDFPVPTLFIYISDNACARAPRPFLLVLSMKITNSLEGGLCDKSQLAIAYFFSPMRDSNFFFA